MNIEKPEMGQPTDLLQAKFDRELMPLLAGLIVNIKGQSVRLTDIFRYLWNVRGGEGADYILRLTNTVSDVEGYLLNNGVSQEERQNCLGSLKIYLDEQKRGDTLPSAGPEPLDRFIP